MSFAIIGSEHYFINIIDSKGGPAVQTMVSNRLTFRTFGAATGIDEFVKRH